MQVLCPVLFDYCCHLYFSLTLKSVKLVEGVQKVFTKRLWFPKLSHRNYSSRLELFFLETLQRKRIKLDIVLLYKLIWFLWSHLWFLDCSSNIFSTRGILKKSTLNCLIMIFVDIFTSLEWQRFGTNYRISLWWHSLLKISRTGWIVISFWGMSVNDWLVCSWVLSVADYIQNLSRLFFLVLLARFLFTYVSLWIFVLCALRHSAFYSEHFDFIWIFEFQAQFIIILFNQ